MIAYSLIAGLVAFYIINLALGLYQGRNVRTASEYVFGNRYSTGVLLLTFTATLIGANYVTRHFRSSAFFGGASLLLFVISFCLEGLFVTYYLFPKLRGFKGWYTLGDITRQAYGSRYAQLVVESISVFSSIILLSAQLVALNRISPLLGIGQDATLAPYILMIAFTLVVIMYASRSGTPGVVSTDVLQMVLIFSVISFIAYKVLNLKLGTIHIQGLGDLWRQVKLQYGSNPFMSFPKHPSFPRMLLKSMFPTATLLLFSPAFIKRVGMASDNRQLKRSMIGFITVFSFFMLIMFVIGWSLYIVHGGLMKHNEVFPTLLKIVSSQLWMRLLLLIMVVAAIMSTADSILTATSVCAVRMVMSLKDNSPKLPAPSLGKLRLANVVLGCLALALAFLFMHRPIIDFVTFATLLLACLLPCVVGISLGIKRSSKALLGGMACFGMFFIGSILVGQLVDLSFLEPRWLLSSFPLRLKYTCLLPFVIVLSVLAYVVFEVMVHKGFKWEARERFTEAKPSMFRRGWIEIKSFFSSPVLWAEQKVDVYESRGVLLMLICIVALTSLLAGTPLHPAYLKPMAVLMMGVFALCTFNLFPEEWYQKLRGYYPLYWIVSVVICLPFAFFLRWLYHPTSLNTFYLVFVPVILQFFMGRHLSTTLALVGYIVGFGVYRMTGDVGVVSSATNGVVVLGVLFCTTLLTWIGGGYHMQKRLKRANRPKLWASSWGHDLNHLFSEMQMEVSLEYSPLPTEEKQRLKEAERRIGVMSQHIKHFINQTQAFKELISRDSIRDSEIGCVSLSKAVHSFVDTLPSSLKDLIDIKGKGTAIKIKTSSLLDNVLRNVVRNAWKVGAEKVVFDWDDEKPILYIKDNGPGVPKEKLATLFEPSVSRDGTGIGLPFVKEALAKMGALIDVENSGEGAVFMILFEQKRTV